MTKDWDRRPRRRGFDEDDYPPPFKGIESRDAGPRPQASSEPPTTGKLKWYNAEKGFGFVEITDGSGDAFVHASVLERSGNHDVPPGSTLEFRVAPGQKGPQVTEVISVDTSTAVHEPGRRPTSDRAAYPQVDEHADAEEFGTVKFFATAKGFGFIARESGGKDAFVHVSALNRAGVPVLAEGQRVAMTLRQGNKGPEVVRLRLI